MTAVAVCHFPAQDLLSLNEMRAVVADGTLPENFAERCAVCFEGRDLAASPNVSYWTSSPHKLTDLMSWEEMDAVADGKPVPADFSGRVARLLEDEVCTNCDNRLCMGCVLREYDHDCADDCPMCC